MPRKKTNVQKRKAVLKARKGTGNMAKDVRRFDEDADRRDRAGTSGTRGTGSRSPKKKSK